MPHRQMLLYKLDKIAEDQKVNLDTIFMNYVNELFDEEGSEENIVDGCQDKQIDIIQIDQMDNFNIIRIFQVKKERGFKSTTVTDIQNGLNWIFKKDIKDVEILKNYSFMCKIKEVRESIGTNYKNTIVEVYYVTLGALSDIREEDEIYQEIKTIEDQYKEQFGEFKFSLLGSKELIDIENEKFQNKRCIDATLNIQYDINRSSLIQNYCPEISSVICFIKAFDLVKLIDQHFNTIFDMNVRKYLNVKGKVNSKIYESCTKSKEAEIFSVLNNGITIICDELSVNPVPNKANINMKNLQIINGCQTSVTLYTAFKNNELDENTVLLVKVHETQDPVLIEKIIIATNNQNPINPRDLKANTDEQIILQKFFKETYGLNYQRKRNDNKDLNGNILNKAEIISNEKVGQATLAITLQQPHKALGSKSIVFNSEYENIFNLKKIDLNKYVLNYIIYSKVEQVKKELLKSLNNQFDVEVVKYGSYHISYITDKLMTRSNFEINQQNIKEILDDSDIIKEFIVKAIQIAITSIDQEVKKKGTVINYLKTKLSYTNINKQMGL